MHRNARSFDVRRRDRHTSSVEKEEWRVSM
jgi:hypothetical protein